MLQHIFTNLLNLVAITAIVCHFSYFKENTRFIVLLVFFSTCRKSNLLVYITRVKAHALYHVRFTSLNYLSHFDTETVSVPDKLRSEAHHQRSFTSFHERGDTKNRLKRRLEAAVQGRAISCLLPSFCACLVWCLCPTLLMTH